MNPSRTDSVIQFALLEAGRQDDFMDRDLGPIHLLKFVYLADLAHAEKHEGESFTGAHWRFYHYGPWAAEVYDRIEPALDAIHAQKESLSSTKYDADFLRWRLTDDVRYAELERVLPQRVVSTVRKAVRQFGKDTGELLNYVYTTGPMRRARPGSELVLFVREPEGSAPSTSPPPAPLSARQEKRRNERLAQARGDIKQKLAARRAARKDPAAVTVAPRYDDVFERGIAWLDELGHSADGIAVDGEVHIDDEVWTSDTRGDDHE